MTFLEFLGSSLNKNFWDDNFIYCFRSKQYPVMFFATLFQSLISKNLLEQKPQMLQASIVENSTILHTLSSSFLGNTTFYNLGEIGIKSDKKTSELLKFLASYEGPNKILFFLSSEASNFDPKTKLCKVIYLDDEIDFKTFTLLANAFGKEKILQKQFLIKKIFDRTKTLSLDTFCMILEYLDLAGSNNKEFEKFISHIIESKESLHTLSKHFFSKNSFELLNTWIKIKDDYPLIFWITFWSEQLWQAFNATKLLENGKLIEAKKIGYRLPFIFFNQLWKNCNTEEMASAHNFIYLADFHLKNGSLFDFFELFFSKYLSGEFSSSNKIQTDENFPISYLQKLM